MKIAVVGGGVVGLTTALQIQNELHNADITVIASSFDNTVSHVAAGIFRVGSSYSGPNEILTREWIKNSYEYYDEIRKSYEAAYAGVINISGYRFANSSPKTVQDKWIEKLVPLYRKATEDEFQLVNGNWKYGSFFTTLMTQCSLYLPWAQKKLKNGGTIFKTQHLDSFSELIPEYNAIINCSGFGARDLCNDDRMVSIKGQVIKVEAPWLKTFFYGELDTYLIPNCEGIVTLGGSRNFDSENLTWCPHESAAIRERCEKLIPSIGKAKTVDELVGLRPHRENNVRVEIDWIQTKTCKTMIIHNYGHGGYGVCTAPGTSKYAVQLLMDAHKSTKARL